MDTENRQMKLFSVVKNAPMQKQLRLALEIKSPLAQGHSLLTMCFVELVRVRMDR